MKDTCGQINPPSRWFWKPCPFTKGHDGPCGHYGTILGRIFLGAP